MPCTQQHSSVPLINSPVACHPDATSFLGVVSDIPGTVGVRAQHDARGHVHLSVLSARRGRRAAALPSVQGAALSAHDHQRATGTRGARRVAVHRHTHTVSESVAVIVFLDVNVPTEPGPCHWLVRLSAGCLPSTSSVRRWSRPFTKLPLHRANVPHYPQLAE